MRRLAGRGTLPAGLAAGITAAALALEMALGGLLPGGRAAAEGTQEPSPVRVRFELPERPAPLGEAAPVTLVAETNPDSGVDLAGQIGEAEILLRLPAGIRLDSQGWKPAGLPAGEREEENGSWQIYERAVPTVLSAVKREFLRQTLLLAVTQDGLNWVVTARVRVRVGARLWQALAILFATTAGETAEFHAIPRR